MRSLGQPLNLRSRSRDLRVLALLIVVVLAHAIVLLAIMRPVAPGSAAAVVSRAPALEVRRLPLPSLVAIAPVDASAPAAPRRTGATRKPVAATRAETAVMQTPVPSSSTEPPTTTTPVVGSPAPTRVPPSVELVFALQSGADSGQAHVSWQAEGDRYALSLHATLPSGREIEQTSHGGFDAAGIAPLRLADRKGGRDVRAANFQREHGKVTFSGPRWELPLEAGTQDRLSWLLQLVALAQGAPDGLREGHELAMWVVGARGAASHWRFEVRGRERVAFAGQDCDTWWLVREPVHPYDTRVEVWLDTTSGHWPLRLRQAQIPGGQPLDWSLQRRTALQPGT